MLRKALKKKKRKSGTVFGIGGGLCNKSSVLQLCHKKFIDSFCYFSTCGNLPQANACKIMQCQFITVVCKGKATGLGVRFWEYLTLSLLFLIVSNGKKLLIYAHCSKRKKERNWSLL